MLRRKGPALVIIWLMVLAVMLSACGKTYTVSFNTDGGIRVGGGELQQKVREGEDALSPLLEKNGYRFSSWNDSFTSVKSDKVVTAIWEKVYTVVFNLNGGTLKSGETEQTVKAGEGAMAPEVIRDGYELIGWDTDFSKVNKDLSVNAKWARLHTVTFLLNGGTATGADTVQTVREGEAAVPPTVVRMGYAFGGWDGDYTSVTSDVTITAKWVEAHTVTFLPEGGTITSGSAVQNVADGGSATAPTVTRSGYAFVGWDKDYSNVKGDLLISAKWAKIHTVTFDLDGGTLSEGSVTQYIVNGEAAEAPSCYKSGYVLSGWSASFGTVYSDMTIKAIWTEAVYTSTEIYDLAAPATVELTVYDSMDVARSIGTGFFVDSNGTIVTNYHVVEGAFSIEATLSDGSVYEVTQILGYDADLDLALIKIEKSGTSYLEKSARGVKTGDTVYAIGSSRGLTGTFSEGIISTAARIVEGINCIQITAPISEGNSGGPLLNKYGEVIGINSMTLTTGQNINFAINISELDKVDTSEPLTMEEFYRDTTYYKIWIYDINLPEIEHNNSLYTAQTISENGTTINGSVSHYGDNDFYKYTAQKAGELTVLLVSEYPEDNDYLYCVLVDGEGNILATTEDIELDDGTYIQALFYNVEQPQTIYLLCGFNSSGYPYVELPNYDLFVYIKE